MFGEDDGVVSHIQRGGRFVVDNALESAGLIMSADIRDEPVDDALGVLGEEACFIHDGGVVRMGLVYRPRLKSGSCRWSCCGTNPEVSPMCGMEFGSVGLKQPLRNIVEDCGLEAEPHVWKAAASVACLVRVWG